MRHADREIRDRAVIKAILDMCDVINIGFFDEEYPYVLPVNFGYEFEDNLVFYTHHAEDGYKNKLIENNPKVCVVTHKFIDHIQNDYDNTHHDYRSVMAFGEITKIPHGCSDYARGWEAICACNSRQVPQSVFDPAFKIMLCKIVCSPENVIGKAQRHITEVEQVPMQYGDNIPS